jgi:Uma2 family endonuclease
MMATPLASSPDIPTLADLLDRLGGISAERVRYYPLPGTASDQDVIDIEQRENRLCELVDGVLVEKPMGYRESFLACIISTLLNNFVMPRKLGIVTGSDGMIRLFPGLIRIPDVAFVSTAHLPGGRLPKEAIPTLSPDLAVEVLSKGNTRREMQRKLREYFASGTRLAWFVDLEDQTVSVYRDPENCTILAEDSVLDGEDVLPGFTMDLKSLFANLES